jgi:tetratricopeptide (TPR) repeat protein
LELLAEIGALIGAGNYEGLRALLAASDLSVQELLDLAESQRQQGGCPVMRVFWETVVGPKRAAATEYQLAKAHIRLGNCLYADGRHAEAITQLEACAALVPETDLAMEALHGTAFCYWNLGRPLEALPNLAKVQGWNPPPKYRDFGRWLIAQTYGRADQWDKARESFVVLEQTGAPIFHGIARDWQANCDREARRAALTKRLKQEGR